MCSTGTFRIIFTTTTGWTVDGNPISSELMADSELIASYLTDYDLYCSKELIRN